MKDVREQLEVEALRLAQQGGLKGLSFRTLATRVGIKSSSVHYHFPEKTDLARALISRYSEQFFERLEKISNSRASLKNKLRSFIGIFEEVAAANKLCLCGMIAAEVESIDETNRALLNDYFSGTEKWLQLLFEENAEELQSDFTSTQMAKVILSGLEGALLLDRSTGEQHHLRAQKELCLSLIK